MLTPERIMEFEQQSYVDGSRPVYSEDCWGDKKVTYKPTKYFNMFMFARAIEAEVRKQDTELIRQMLEAMESVSAFGRVGSRDVEQAALQAAITTDRARLENTP